MDKITDHPFRPCHYDQEIRRWGGDPLHLCMSPSGPFRCHKGDCGRLEEEHERSERKDDHVQGTD